MAEEGAREELLNILRYSGPVALVNLCQAATQVIDLAVIGRTLPFPCLAAACLCLVLSHLLHEPAAFIVANAMTTLCTDAFHARATAYAPAAFGAADYLKGALVFCLLLSLPVGVLVTCSPALLSLLRLPDEVLAAAHVFARWSALAVTPALLQSMLLGFLRAQRRLHSTATIFIGAVGCNLTLALLLVPAFGLQGSVWATALTRYFAVLLLVLYHRDALPFTAAECLHDGARQVKDALRPLLPPLLAAEAAAPPATPLGVELRATQPPLAMLTGLYFASVLPATLRIGGFQLLTLLAFPLSNDPKQSVAVSLITLLLQASLSLCMGIQMATVMLTTRHLYRYRFALARRTMRLAALPLLAIALLVGAASYAFRQSLASPFCADAEVADLVASLSWYLAPMLLLKASSGLHGQYLAVTGRGVVGTYILVVVPWGVGLPAAYFYAAAYGGGALSLLRVHTAAWLLTAAGFAICYSRILPASRQPPTAALSAATAPLPAPSAAANDETMALSTPLLQGGVSSASAPSTTPAPHPAAAPAAPAAAPACTGTRAAPRAGSPGASL
ncbi:hypothetical protein AB1Y20_019652 [Prymnesium parvum]|uniref:Protein RFT1 homolog n=1 Tax=Prymnesium parvum TaxID=97485 RepID=A0AB34JWI5_PRYPA